MSQPTTDEKAKAAARKLAETSDQVATKLWFLDLKFEQFATPKLVGFAFLAWMIFAVCSVVAAAVYAIFNIPIVQAVFFVVVTAISVFIITILVRVFFESLLLVFRMTEHLSHLRQLGHLGYLKPIAQAKANASVSSLRE